jgi:hypothetical protein
MLRAHCRGNQNNLFLQIISEGSQGAGKSFDVDCGAPDWADAPFWLIENFIILIFMFNQKIISEPE